MIELLVVIAVIAILAAILFPVFAQAREKARQTTCTSQIRQLALGVMMYAQDHDETFPLMFTFDAGRPLPPGQNFFPDRRYWTWQNLSMAYVKSQAIHLCPSGYAGRASTQVGPAPAYGGYGANDHVMRYGRPMSDGLDTTVATMSMIVAPAETYLLMDSGNYTADCSDYQDARHPGNYLPGARWNEKCFDNRASGNQRSCRGATRAQAEAYWGASPVAPAGDVVRDALDGRHQRRISVAFCDGHVRSMDPDQLLFNRKGWFDPPKANCLGNPPSY